MILLLTLLACPKPAPDPDSALVTEAPPPPIPPAGTFTEGTFLDVDLPFTVRVPDGWLPRVGNSPDALRVSLTDSVTGVRVEVWAFHEGPLQPRPRAGCTWTFEDTARYRALKVTGDILVATCTPDDPDGPRVLGYYLAHDGVSYHLESVIPEGRLLSGKAAADRIVGTLRYR